MRMRMSAGETNWRSFSRGVKMERREERRENEDGGVVHGYVFVWAKL